METTYCRERPCSRPWRSAAAAPALSGAARERLDKSGTCFRNNLSLMDYAERLRETHLIASGVTETACGLIIKNSMIPGSHSNF